MPTLPRVCKSLIGLLFLLASPALAEPACPEGNLLAGKVPTFKGVTAAARIVDGIAPVEGDAWNTALTAILTSSEAQVTWDLGQEVRLDALLLQGDNNDTYEVQGSVDGTTFSTLWLVPEDAGMGMRTRLISDLAATVRALRITHAAGDEAYSLGEVQAFCTRPTPWPPVIARKTAPAPVTPTDDRARLMADGKMTLGLLALLVFIGLALSRRTREPVAPEPPAGETPRRPLLARLALTTPVGLRIWAFLAFVGFVGFDKLGSAPQTVAAIGHLAAALLALTLYGRERISLALVGRGIAAAGGLATLIFCGLRTRAAMSEVMIKDHPLQANLAWLALAVGLAILVFGFVRKQLALRVEHVSLLAIAFGATLAWTNFWTFHGSRAVHYWDTFHYYMGAKYFSETRYHLLYQCSAIGEVDDGREGEFAKRQIRDLRDNTLGPAKPQLARDEECRKNFTPERWAAFRQDLRLFRSQMGDAWWEKMFKDHGYNASPVWNMPGHLLANWAWETHIPPKAMENSPANLAGRRPDEQRAIRDRFTMVDVPAFQNRIERLALIDGGLYFGLFLLIWWAFGLQTCALAMAILATGYPWAYFWTGGAYGRVAWLFMAVAGVCLMKKGWRVAGGFAVVWSALDRVFPGGMVAGVALKAAWNLVKRRTMILSHRRILLGGVLAVAVLVPASLPYSDGLGAYKEFLDNSMKHRDTPLTNHMGLPSLVAWHPDLIARNTKNDKLDDPFQIWKEKRKEKLHDRIAIFYVLMAGLLALVLLAGRRMPDWEATAISTLIIIGFFDLTCYYYNFIVLWAATGMRRTRYIVALLLMAVVSQIIQLRVGWYDEQYLWETLLVLGCLLYIVIDFLVRHRKDPDLDFEPVKS